MLGGAQRSDGHLRLLGVASNAPSVGNVQTAVGVASNAPSKALDHIREGLFHLAKVPDAEKQEERDN